MQTVLTDSPLSWSALDFSTDPPTYRSPYYCTAAIMSVLSHLLV